MLNWVVWNRTVWHLTVCKQKTVLIINWIVWNLDCVLMLNWVVWNGTVFKYKNGFGIK